MKPEKAKRYVCKHESDNMREVQPEELTGDATRFVTLNSYAAMEAWALEMRKALRWALGEADEFPPRKEGEGAYWWRTELGRRAALQPHAESTQGRG